MPPQNLTLSAGVVVVRRTPGGWRYLLLRAYSDWDFPKGVVEPGETPIAAARREAQEEAGLTDLRFRWGEEYRQTLPYRSGTKVARYYLAESAAEEVRLGISPLLGRPEHHEYRWVDAATAHRLLSPRLQPILEWAQNRIDSPAQTPASKTKGPPSKRR